MLHKTIKTMWKNKLSWVYIFATLTLAAPAYAADVITFDNPIAADSVPQLVDYISASIIAIVLPIAVIFIIVGGFKFVTAQGDPTKIAAARKMLLWTIVGTIFIVGASLLARAVINFVKYMG